MASGKSSNRDQGQGSAGQGRPKKAAPEWADGLRQIYDSVLDEPLPDSFSELLSKLDDPS